MDFLNLSLFPLGERFNFLGLSNSSVLVLPETFEISTFCFVKRSRFFLCCSFTSSSSTTSPANLITFLPFWSIFLASAANRFFSSFSFFFCSFDFGFGLTCWLSASRSIVPTTVILVSKTGLSV